jgi:outer membrane receptor for ferrienterochelin and colicin
MPRLERKTVTNIGDKSKQTLCMKIGWHAIFVFTTCWQSAPLHGWAETSFTPPRTSSATEQKLHKEALYLKEETVSIASRYEQPISRAPSDVYVITDEDIRNSGATDIPTLLRHVPGVEVMQMNTVDFNVSVRGNNEQLANKLLVLVDGRSIYIDQSGTLLWKYLPVALTEIKRIEVLKGPASAVYGFNAFDGVVNIITKPPEEMRGTTLRVAGGGLGTLLSTGVYAGTTGNWGYRVSAGHEQNQQWSDRGSQALSSQRIGGMMEYHLSNSGKLRAEAGLGRANPYDGFVTEISTTDTRLSRAHALLSYEQNGLLVRGWWNGLFPETDHRIFPPLASLLTLTDRFRRTHEDSSYNTYDFETRYRFTPLEAMNINIGVNFRRIINSSRALSNRTTEDRLGLYAQGDWLVLPSLELSAGLRYDLDTFITPTISPRGALVYHVNSNHAFRFSSSIAYRPPTTFDIGLSALNLLTLPGLPPSTSVVLGSTDLKPEKIISYELGYQGWWWEHRLRARVTGFFNHVSDLIAFRSPLGDPLGAVRPINGGVADVYGGEAGVEALVTSWLSGFANYAYQEVGQTSSGFSRRGFPHHKVNAGLRVNWSPFRGEVLYHHVSAASYPLADAFTNLAPFFSAGTILPQERVSSYNLLNLRLGYLIWRQQSGDEVREAELAISVFNALNDNHREHPLGDLLGTRVMGWLTVKL